LHFRRKRHLSAAVRPDVCYQPGALGPSSNAVYNPDQSTYDPYGNGGPGGSGYMRKHFREWLIWYKKQVGFDGVRMDAVKHFPVNVAEDFLYNLQFGALWADGGTSMLAVGEWVGGAGALDGWTQGTQERAGTFDFSLRGALFGMANGEGFYDMSQIPGSQQNRRTRNYGGTLVHRTVPFVNNHDTFRPCVDGSGNYTSVWGNDQCGNGSELAEHISPENWRMPLAYAVAFAVDGNPQVFFEDLFDLNSGNRYSHDPTSDSSLPAQDWLVNLIWCHQNLDFKNGGYSVPSSESSTVFVNNSSSQDLLIIERNDKAFIALNDTNEPKYAWVDTNWPVGTVLNDYSGQTDTMVTVVTPNGGSANRVRLKAPPVGNLTSGQHGFSIWAPVGAASSYLNDPISTTQEWEMADDLGDSHCESLTQAGHYRPLPQPTGSPGRYSPEQILRLSTNYIRS
jgi:alpha-amylase